MEEKKYKITGDVVNDRVTNVDNFHDYNIHVPTRTIYFGKEVSEFGSDVDEVDCQSAAQLIKNLLILKNYSNNYITLYLNTTGGSWEDGMAVYDIIKTLEAPVRIIGIGKIYSMGSVIMQAADSRIMTKNATMMIHDGTSGYVADSKSSEAWSDFSKDIRHIMYKIYYNKMIKINPKITLKEIEDMCSHDRIFSASEAKEVGLIDVVI